MQKRGITLRKGFFDYLHDGPGEVVSSAVIRGYQRCIKWITVSNPLAMHVSMSTEIPISSGLGSSASMSVCIAAGLLAAAGKIGPADLGENRLLGDEQRNKINDLALIGEKIVHGTPSGVDNTIITFGGMHTFANRKPVNRV